MRRVLPETKLKNKCTLFFEFFDLSDLYIFEHLSLHIYFRAFKPSYIYFRVRALDGILALPGHALQCGQVIPDRHPRGLGGTAQLYPVDELGLFPHGQCLDGEEESTT